MIWFLVDVDCGRLWTVVYDCVSRVRTVVVVLVASRRRSRHVIVIRWVDCECVIVNVRYVTSWSFDVWVYLESSQSQRRTWCV